MLRFQKFLDEEVISSEEVPHEKRTNKPFTA